MPLEPTSTKSAADAIANPLLRAYKAGGLILSILTLGAILMVVAFFGQNAQWLVRYAVLAVGAILTFFTLAYVYFKEFPRLREAQASIADNKEMIDAIQQSAIELTVLASDLQSLAFKNAEQIAKLLTTARPLIRQIPGIEYLADSKPMERVEGLSRIIVTTTERARSVIRDLQKSLINADPKYLKVHLEDLKRYRAEVNQMLVGR